LAAHRRGRTTDNELAGLVGEAFFRARAVGNPDRVPALPADTPWTGEFHGLLFGVPEDLRSHRDRLRNAARLAGYAPLRPGLMVSAQDGWSALAEVVSELPDSATIYPLTLRLSAADSRRASAEAWRLPEVAANTEALIARLVAARVVRPFRGRPYWRLVWLWTVFASLQEGFGYFLITGMIPAGDTARAFTLWGLPTWAFFAATAFGVGGLFLTARLFADPVIELSSSITDRRAISVWPWLYGTIVLVLLMGLYVIVSPALVSAGDAVAVMVGAVAVGVYAPMSMMFRSGQVEASEPLRLPRHPVSGYALLGVLILVNLILTRGWLWS
jgi:hypothetical protein